MKKTLRFSIDIRAPRRQVWSTMLDAVTYEAWTAPFCEGSRYEGSWEPGQRLRFLTPGGEGMVSEVVENRPGEFVSIRHLGSIQDGVEDTTSDAVRAWAPSFENYRYTDTGDGTRVDVEVETLPGYEAFMEETFPRALALLKAICEQAGRAGERDSAARD